MSKLSKQTTRTQNDIILRHIRKYKNITSIEAFSLYGITRLAARVYDLKKKGHNIRKVMVNKNDKRWAMYYI